MFYDVLNDINLWIRIRLLLEASFGNIEVTLVKLIKKVTCFAPNNIQWVFILLLPLAPAIECVSDLKISKIW